MNVGIGTFDLHSNADLGFAYDYDSSGKLDHLVFYRPGTGAIYIVKPQPGGTFVPVYAQGDPGAGIGTFDLHSTADLGFAYDYDSSGKLDHLVFYRPGRGAIYILRKQPDGTFVPVYAQGDPGAGIGGFDLKEPSAQAFAFDYDSSGKLDHIVLYAPGTGAIFIVKKQPDGSFTSVYAQGDPGIGIGTYDLHSPADRAFAYDYDSSGKLDHLVLYRPGTSIIYILKNTAGIFSTVYTGGPAPAPAPRPGPGGGNFPQLYCVSAFDDDGNFVGQLTIRANSYADAQNQADRVVAELGGDDGYVSQGSCTGI